MLNIIRYDFWVKIEDSMVFQIGAYMEKIGALLPKWAYFSVIYPAMVKLLEWKTGLKFKVKTWFISQGLDNKHMWGLWLKKISSFYIWMVEDWEFTREEVDRVAWNVRGAGHNHAWKIGKKSHQGKIVESWGGFIYKCSIGTLKHAVNKGLYYNKARTIIPADFITEEVQKACIAKAKASKSKNISFQEFIEIRDQVKSIY